MTCDLQCRTSSGLPANAGSPSNVVIEGAVMDGVTAALVKLPNVHCVTAVRLEVSEAFVLLHQTAWKRSDDNKKHDRNCTPMKKQNKE